MSIYFIGDVHGCYNELCKLLDIINYDDNKDQLLLTGDLIFRGNKSLEVLKLIYKLKNTNVVLGNHELNLLAINNGILLKNNNLAVTNNLVFSSELEEIINWLKLRPILIINKIKKFIVVHAGILPFWGIKKIIKYAKEIEFILKSKYCKYFFYFLFKNIVHEELFELFTLNKLKCIKFNISVFTRIRYYYNYYQLDNNYLGNPVNKPIYLIPWFNRVQILNKYSIIFGHWSVLLSKYTPNKIYNIDTGCCWGKKLTALCWDNKKYYYVNKN
ncbi:MAG: symmetrical bis(5'-nucleosyl)-tetraphosphatase [Candidatus Lightella neohaematopini]|nr:symmetrical bis(5'-nucleosyl)-tetraphosphatase [Candidatus Lightella neohaematopini]MCV2528752.1 symmetrical bis(5'-nucleosyl)-tetraphosphatase [Candidatus Lightella neohaematopini]